MVLTEDGQARSARGIKVKDEQARTGLKRAQRRYRTGQFYGRSLTSLAASSG
jgi:hypothetical protein